MVGAYRLESSGVSCNGNRERDSSRVAEPSRRTPASARPPGRLGRSWLAAKPVPVYGLEFYLSASFWLLLWCLLLLWAFCGRLRRGLRGQIDQLATGWQNASSAAGIFAHVEADCRRVEHFRRELDALRQEVEGLQRQLAGSP